MRVLGMMLGWQTYPAYGRHAYIVQESVGAYLAVLAIVIWRGRRHFLQTLRHAWIGNQETDEPVDAPISYQIAWIGMVGGIAVLIFFCYRAGMSISISIGFVLFYYAVSTAITRLRAEVGFPDHDVHFSGPVQMISSALGTANLSQRTRAVLPLFWYMSRRFDPHIMPHQLEAFKIAGGIEMSHKTTFWSMILASVLGIVVSFWLLLHVSCQFGADNILQFPYWEREPWSYLQEWVHSPTETDYHHISLMGLGVMVASFLAFMRARFIWWPLHPMGYTVAGSYGMSFLWSCMLVSWVLKSLILQYGGLKRYRQTIPLFLGLVLGEFSIASIWTIIGIVLHLPKSYLFWIL